MNLHEEISRIKSVMGLLTEQTITLPQIISGSFQSYDADLAHKLSKLESKLDSILPKIYSQGINPKMYDVSLSVVRNRNTYTTSYSLKIDKSDDGKAWTGFASRGSIGENYIKRADGQIDGTENEDGRPLKEKLESIGADEIIEISGSPIIDDKVKLKQYFFQFTKISNPSHTTSTTGQQPKTTTGQQPKTTTGQQPKNVSEKIINIDVTTDAVIEPLNDLSKKFKEESDNKISANNNQLYYFDEENSPGFTINSDNSINYKITLKNTGTPGYGFKKYRLLFGRESLDNVRTKNPGSLVLNFGTVTSYGNEYEYFLVGIKF